MTKLYELAAATLQTMIRRRECSATDIIESCRERIEAMEPNVKGFVHFDRSVAPEQAGRDRDEHGDMMSDRFREIVDRGRAVTEQQYQAALDKRKFCCEHLNGILQHDSIILAPAMDGVAPLFSERTGDQKIQSLWERRRLSSAGGAVQPDRGVARRSPARIKERE